MKSRCGSVQIGKRWTNNIDGHSWPEFLSLTIELMLEKQALNLRTLLKINDRNILNDRIINIGRSRTVVIECPGILYFDILRKFFPTAEEMGIAINRLDFKDNIGNTYLTNIFIAIANYENVYYRAGNHIYQGYTYSGIDTHHFMANINDDNIPISTTLMIQDACKNYIKYFK